MMPEASGSQTLFRVITPGAGVSINHCIPKELAEGMECLKMAAPFGPIRLPISQAPHESQKDRFIGRAEDTKPSII
jgi:hypothetical protein